MVRFKSQPYQLKNILQGYIINHKKKIMIILKNRITQKQKIV